jgi:hypothetical protein
MISMSYSHQLDFAPVPMKEVEEPKKTSDQWCESDENSKDDDIIYVNLQENRESYTAYNGSNIWNAIYEENCLFDRID